MKYIVDFDNTFGVKYRDVDDFLALMYMIKSKADIELVTTTFGNDTIEVVNRATDKVIRDLDIKLNLAYGNKDAATKIVEVVNKNDDITIITLGSLHNVRKAYELDSSIVTRTKIISMGTISEDLIINNKKMDELNFSCDYESGKIVLENFEDISIVSANNCLDYYIKSEEIERIFGKSKYLKENAYDWFRYHAMDYELDYIIIWDLITAVYALMPEMFVPHYKKVNFEHLEKGLLVEDEKGKEINFPVLKSRESFITEIENVF